MSIFVDLEAIATDTLQGVRQFALQSGMNYQPTDSVANIYTVPWWTSAIDGKYVNHFVSSLIRPSFLAQILNEVQPNILSLYPTNLESLIFREGEWRRDHLKLIVTHSEQSARASRDKWSRDLDVPILDEYSSEEATRIALELPCGHYHVCDDTVIVEILDPKTLRPQEPGQPGIVVITNLLNEAMPFIRYIQGDIATLGGHSGCDVSWSTIETLEGRLNDAFLTRAGKIVPAGTLLDATYRMMYDVGLSLEYFEVRQADYDTVVLTMPSETRGAEMEAIRKRLSVLLAGTMEQPVDVLILPSNDLERSQQVKRRPIRRAFSVE